MPDSTSGNPGHSRVELKKKLLETSKGAVQLAALALEVAACAAHNVPYLGSISIVLKEIIRITDEVDVCKATWKAVKSEVHEIQILVTNFSKQCTGNGLTDEELPETVKEAFKDFEVCLLKIIVAMDKCKTNSKRFTDRIRLISKRSEITGTANQCKDDIASALRIFQATLQMDQWTLQIAQGKSINDLRNAVMPHAPLIARLNSITPTFILPLAPSIFYGRSGEVQDVVDLVVNHGPTRVAIVGSGGIGKTSIALTAIHHPSVVKGFLHQRFFLSCEAIFTADTLVLELLKHFGLSIESSSSRPPSDTLKLHVQAMTSKCLLCLDNFETPWDLDKDTIKSLLVGIDVHHLTLMITSRDLDRPRGIKWGALKPIQPLTLDAAIETWDAISQGHDDFSLCLIKAVDCIPLAVTLLAQLAEVESSEALWASWNSESTRLVKSDGSVHRLNNLELSIELSLHGPRLRACLGALDFFVILCMLPQGLPESKIADFETAFAEDFKGLRSAIRILKQCSLAYSLDGFLRVLSPIRQYMQSHPNLSTALSKTLFIRMTNHYLDLVPPDHSYIDSNVVREAIQLETGNISAVLDMCLAEDMDLHRVLNQLICFSRICLYLNVYDTRLLLKAASIARDFSRGLEADCYFQQAQAMIYFYIDNLSEAENILKAALNIHREVNDRGGQGNDLRQLGQLYQRLHRFAEAETAILSALKLHKEIDNKLCQGNDLQALGDLYQRFARLEDAEKSLQSALNLHKEVNARLGQANGLLALGQLYKRLNRLQDAEEALQSAFILYTEMDFRLGSANCQQELGELYQRLDQLNDAEQALKSALNLHREVTDKLGQANDLQELGKLYHSLGRLEDTEKALKSALALHREVDDRLGQANDLRQLGELYQGLERLEDADKALNSALDLRRGIDDSLGQAIDLVALGILYMKLDRLEDAETMLQSALKLHREINNRIGQASDLQILGMLYQRLEKIKDAEESHRSALDIYTELNLSVKQGNELQSLGLLCINQQRFSEAEDFLSRAMDIHERAHHPGGQQYTQMLLDYVHKKQEQSDVVEEDVGKQVN